MEWDIITGSADGNCTWEYFPPSQDSTEFFILTQGKDGCRKNWKRHYLPPVPPSYTWHRDIESVVNPAPHSTLRTRCWRFVQWPPCWTRTTRVVCRGECGVRLLGWSCLRRGFELSYRTDTHGPGIKGGYLYLLQIWRGFTTDSWSCEGLKCLVGKS